MNYSHTLLIPEITQVQKVKWCRKQNLFNTSFSTHVSMANWLDVRLQSKDGCCWEIKSHWRQLFSKFIFPEFYCLADILSDFLSDILISKNPNDIKIVVVGMRERTFTCRTIEVVFCFATQTQWNVKVHKVQNVHERLLYFKNIFIFYHCKHCTKLTQYN